MAPSGSTAPTSDAEARGPWQVKVLFDGDCPLCRREMEALARRDRHGRLALEDIAAPEFDPARYGLTQEQAMDRIHGVLPDGTVVEGMEVFRRAYAAVGLGWLLAPTAWPLLGGLFDRAYRWFARNRLRLTGRAGEGHACREGHCPAPHRAAGR